MSLRFAGSGWLLVIGMALAAGAALLATHDLTPSERPPAAAPLSPRTAIAAPTLAPPTVASSVATPPSLAGTDIPSLPLDSGGHLLHDRRVRDFFDYYLTAQHEVAPLTLDLLVKDSIRHQLGNRPATGEAMALWQRYQAYLTALASLPPIPSNAGTGTADLDAIATALDQRMRLADRYLSQDGWSEVFFGEQWKNQRNDLERLRIQADPTLSPADRAARLAVLDTALPADERTRREQSRKQEQAIDQALALQAKGATPAQVGDAVLADAGPDAAARATAMAQIQQAWQLRYAAYAEQRDQIVQQSLPTAQQDALLDALRHRFFSSTAEATRAAAFDRATMKR